MRTASIERNTKETQITGTLNIDGTGQYQVSTGIRFFDHMLELFTKHGGFGRRPFSSRPVSRRTVFPAELPA